MLKVVSYVNTCYFIEFNLLFIPIVCLHVRIDSVACETTNLCFNECTMMFRNVRAFMYWGTSVSLQVYMWCGLITCSLPFENTSTGCQTLIYLVTSYCFIADCDVNGKLPTFLCLKYLKSGFWICIYNPMYVWACTRFCVYVHASMYMYTSVCVYSYIHTHIYNYK